MAQFDRSLTAAYLIILLLTLLANFRLIPVFPHMLLIVLCTIYIGCRLSVRAVHKHEEDGAAGSGASGSSGSRRTAIDNDIVDVVCDESTTPQAEHMKRHDAMMFPIMGSIVLFSLYLVFKLLPKHLINYVLKAYFFLIGTIVVAAQLSTTLPHYLPKHFVDQAKKKEFVVPNPEYYVNKVSDAVTSRFSKKAKRSDADEGATCSATGCTTSSSSSSSSTAAYGTAANPASVLTIAPTTSVTVLDLSSLGLAILLSVWYITTGHFAASNLFGIAFSIQGIQMLSLGSFMNGAILLCGLFVYDVFWVFGTDVMVTVAKSFDAPIKLLFPQYINPFGEAPSTNPSASMLGLGDIVIPGIFVALMLRFDIHNRLAQLAQHQQQPRPVDTTTTGKIRQFIALTPYFTTVFIFYAIGLTTTVAIMYYFHAAQPALLYLVPACLGSAVVVAYCRGEIKLLFGYEEVDENAEQEKNKEKEKPDDKTDATTTPATTTTETKKEK